MLPLVANALKKWKLQGRPGVTLQELQLQHQVATTSSPVACGRRG
jgi:hypothetical protein